MTTILVIDDDEAIRNLLCDILRDEGYETLAAEGGREGLAILQARQCDLIICDLMMPLMGGEEFVAQLESYPPVPLILVSAATTPVPEGLPPETIFVGKPFNIPTFLRIVQERLAQAARDRPSARAVEDPGPPLAV